MNIMMLLEMAASGFPERIAVRNGSEQLSYAELFEAARRGAAYAVNAGVERLALLDVTSCWRPHARKNGRDK